MFYVKTKAQSNPENRRKFKRACSLECTNQLKSKNMKRIHETTGMPRRKPTSKQKELCRELLIDLYCFKHLHLDEIRKIVKVRMTTLRDEMKRLEVPKEFYRECPNCGCTYSVKMRCMVDPSSNKFKKYCSRKCFLSSRNQTNTWIELEIEAFLSEQNIQYTTQFEIDRMTVDFMVPGKNLIIEANGDFWHANPEIYGNVKPLHKIHPRVIAKDKRKLTQLNEKGYRVLIVWENDLKTKKSETLRALLNEIKSA